jgi:ribosome-binding factor A
MFRRELSRLLLSEIKDPRVNGVTVTEVRVTSDLSYATVFVTVDGSENREAALEGLERASGFIRREMGQILHLRKIPEFRFEVDTTLANATRIEQLLRAAKESDRAAHADPDVDAVTED